MSNKSVSHVTIGGEMFEAYLKHRDDVAMQARSMPNSERFHDLAVRQSLAVLLAFLAIERRGDYDDPGEVPCFITEVAQELEQAAHRALVSLTSNDDPDDVVHELLDKIVRRKPT